MLSLKLGHPGARARDSHSDESMSATDILRELNRQYVAAWQAGDVGWYREHLAEDFGCIESDGSRLDKQAFLRITGTGSGLAAYELGEVDLRLYGHVALVRATGRWIMKDGTRGESVYTDVYVRAEDRWRVVSAQITRRIGDS